MITFKATTPKKMSLEGDLSSLVILALDEIRAEEIDPETEGKIKAILQNETLGLLEKNLAIASGRIHDYILNLLKK